jgi:hypothetical protein
VPSAAPQAISKKIMEMDVMKAEIRTVDSQESLGGGVTVLVTGHLTGHDGVRREFSQSFFLAPQEKGYFVLNDMFRFVADDPSLAATAAQPEVDAVLPPVAAPLANGTSALAAELVIPENGVFIRAYSSASFVTHIVKLIVSPLFVDPVSQQEQHVVEPAPLPPEDEEEIYNPLPEESVEEEQPVPEVIDEVPNNVAPVAATTVTPVSQEEAPKKSYASIVGFQNQLPQVLNCISCSCT